jgi:hypothetical protein
MLSSNSIDNKTGKQRVSTTDQSKKATEENAGATGRATSLTSATNINSGVQSGSFALTFSFASGTELFQRRHELQERLAVVNKQFSELQEQLAVVDEQFSEASGQLRDWAELLREHLIRETTPPTPSSGWEHRKEFADDYVSAIISDMGTRRPKKGQMQR